MLIIKDISDRAAFKKGTEEIHGRKIQQDLFNTKTSVTGCWEKIHGNYHALPALALHSSEAM